MAGNVAARWAQWERRGGRTASALDGGSLPVTFPTTDLQCRVWIALTPDYRRPWWEWGWANITDYVRWDPGITVTDGRRDESGTVTTLNGSMLLENDGRFARRYAFGPYYPYLTRNTPIWAEVNPGDAWHTRLQGYVNSWPKRWDTTGRDSVAPISVGGVMRRLEQADTLRSPMYRSMAGIAADDYVPHAYWPLEDGTDSTQFATAIPGRTVMTFTGTVTPGADDSLRGSASLPQFEIDAVASATIPAYADTNLWAFQVVFNIPSMPLAEAVYFEVDTPGGSFVKWRLRLDPFDGFGPTLWWEALDAAGVQGPATSIFLDGSSADFMTEEDFFGNWFMVSLMSRLVGGAVSAGLGFVTEDGLHDSGGESSTGGPHTHAIPTAVRLYGGEGMSAGHVAFFKDTNVPFSTIIGTGFTSNAQAMRGYVGEMAHDRIRRLCREEQVPFYCLAQSSAALGTQPSGTLLDVLRDAAKADRGVLHEHEFGLAYQPPGDRQNQPVHLALDQAEGQLAEYVEADDDDQTYINQWTASRVDGSSSTFRDPDFRNADGLYAGGDTYNVHTDGQLPDIAGFEVRKGTLDEDRWPSIGIDLGNHPELIAAWVAMPFGGRVQAANAHEQAGVDVIDAISEGRQEHWNSRQWTGRMNTTPASVHTVAVYDDGQSRYGATDSTLAAAVDDAATSWIVDPGVDVWATTVTHPSVFPLNVTAGGVDYSCTAINSSIRATFSSVAASGWPAADTGQAWTIGSGTASTFSGTGTVGRVAVSAVNSEHYIGIDVGFSARQRIRVFQTLAVTPTGAAINWGGLLRYDPGANSAYWIDVQVGTDSSLTLRVVSKISGANTLLASEVSATTHSTSVARILMAEIDEANTIRAKVYANGATEPGWELVYDASAISGLDTGTRVGCIARLMSGNTNVGPVNFDFDNFAVIHPYEFTVDRLPTDKPHAAGDAVTVTDTGRYGL